MHRVRFEAGVRLGLGLDIDVPHPAEDVQEPAIPDLERLVLLLLTSELDDDEG